MMLNASSPSSISTSSNRSTDVAEDRATRGGGVRWFAWRFALALDGGSSRRGGGVRSARDGVVILEDEEPDAEPEDAETPVGRGTHPGLLPVSRRRRRRREGDGVLAMAAAVRLLVVAVFLGLQSSIFDQNFTQREGSCTA
jgi:hypothetical protein